MYEKHGKLNTNQLPPKLENQMLDMFKDFQRAIAFANVKKYEQYSEI